MSANKVAQHIALSTGATGDSDSQYNINIDREGWAMMECYIWDIGEDEEIERLIDKALRILLIHPEFETFIWKNQATLEQIYSDQSFGDVVSRIHRIMKEITNAMVVSQIENTSAFAKIKKNVNVSNLKTMMKHVAGKSDLDVSAELEIKVSVDEEVELGRLTAKEMFASSSEQLNARESAQKYAFWNITVYNQLKKCFAINNKAREAYFWSFLLSIACCIKYLEIEINAMPQFEMKKARRSQQDKQKAIWKGFVVPPTHGTVGVNYHIDDGDADQISTQNTEFIAVKVEKRATLQIIDEREEENCAGCFVRMDETNWHKDGRPYCSQCIKLRVYQECVRKFVLEYDNEETRDDLWPWYENNKNLSDQMQYKEILDMYSDQVLTIGTILESNLKFYVPRSQTLDAAKLRPGPSNKDQLSSQLADNDNKEQIKSLLIKSRTQFQPYRNIRYLRKFAAMFLLGDREIWKDLFKLKKYLKRLRFHIKSRSVKMSAQLSAESELKFDKSAIDDESGFKITVDDRVNIAKLLEDEDITQLLYGKHGRDRINEIQQQIINRRHFDGEKSAKMQMTDTTDEVFDADAGRFLRKQSSAVNNIVECRPGIDKFLQVWSRLPLWWEPLHDQILLELALMHRLDVAKFLEELDVEEYYQEQLEDHYYKAFEFWCTKTVNVQHRLRFLLFVLDQRSYPDSMIFMNDIMKYSHLSSFQIYAKRNARNRKQSGYGSDDNDNDRIDEEKGDSASIKRKESALLQLVDDYDEARDEKPVRNIEREFRDIVQLLEPEALGVRIWRFIMNQMAAKQRPSLWKALTVLAEELPSNMILSLLEEDRHLLRRGKPRYVNAVCQAVIKGSNYPTATALHLARYMDENADADLARTEVWREFSRQYEEIAIYLVNEVESDHLLALLLEIPTDIQQKTIIEMAVLYKRVAFINSARVQGVMTHMWSETEFLNPNKAVRTTYLSAYGFFKLLWKSPVRFYYCPLGLYATTALLYIGYLLLVSYVSWIWVYPYTKYEFWSLETLMWISNGGYILYELLEFESKRAQYFAMDSLVNVFDSLISVNWILLFFLRLMAPVVAGGDYMGEPGLDPNIDRSSDDAHGSALERTDPSKRNDSYTIVYMLFWGIQVVILWIRIVGLLQRTEIMGPLLRMMLYIAKDIASFLILVVAVTFGFLFAIHFIVGGDIDRDVTCGISTIYIDRDDCEEASQAINSMRGILLYLIQTLLGQQDWDVLDTNELYGFSRGRAQLLTIVVLLYILLGTILCLNMLIAIMTTSFDQLNEEAKAQLAFLRVETTYDLAHRGRMMPPPFNIFVFIVWLFITLINIFIKLLSCGRCKLKLDGINPYYISCLRRGNQHGDSSIIQKERNVSHSNYSSAHEKKSVAREIERLNSSNLTRGDIADIDDENAENKSRWDQLLALFERIDSLADDTKKRYCKHCYCRMKDIKEGRVDDYFKCFEPGNSNFNNSSSFGLDADDMRMIKRLFRYCSLCPQCFRPFSVWSSGGSSGSGSVEEHLGDLGSDRHDRHHVLMEVISCYFFLLLVWVPLLIVSVLPALFSKIFTNVSKSEQSGYASNKQLDAGAFGDYHRGVQQQIVKNIVDKQYNGRKAFDEDFDSDDENMMNENENDKLQRIIYELMQKMDNMNDEKSNGDIKNYHHLTPFQSLQKQKEKNLKNIRFKKKKEKKLKDEDVIGLMMDTTELKKSIRSVKNVSELDFDDANIEEEEEDKLKKVSFQDDNERNDDEQP